MQDVAARTGGGVQLSAVTLYSSIRRMLDSLIVLSGAGRVQRVGGPVEAIRRALAHLPASLRDPLLESMQGVPARAIADDFACSQSTVHRRIKEARDHVRAELGPDRHDGAGGAHETVTDPVLERSQRLFEQTFAPPFAPRPGRAPDR